MVKGRNISLVAPCDRGRSSTSSRSQFRVGAERRSRLDSGRWDSRVQTGKKRPPAGRASQGIGETRERQWGKGGKRAPVDVYARVLLEVGQYRYGAGGQRWSTASAIDPARALLETASIWGAGKARGTHTDATYLTLALSRTHIYDQYGDEKWRAHVGILQVYASASGLEDRSSFRREPSIIFRSVGCAPGTVVNTGSRKAGGNKHALQRRRKPVRPRMPARVLLETSSIGRGRTGEEHALRRGLEDHYFGREGPHARFLDVLNPDSGGGISMGGRTDAPDLRRDRQAARPRHGNSTNGQAAGAAPTPMHRLEAACVSADKIQYVIHKEEVNERTGTYEQRQQQSPGAHPGLRSDTRVNARAESAEGWICRELRDAGGSGRCQWGESGVAGRRMSKSGRQAERRADLKNTEDVVK
ncbi:hypothetical protein DFH09DRAFT_1097041 [Mycena vulgaris]|nr:hypothetical protein DFH09DRAFT_1097041 [Mycena vulgaris]